MPLEAMVAAGLQLVSKIGEQQFDPFGGSSFGSRDGDNDGLVNEGGKSVAKMAKMVEDGQIGTFAPPNGHITSHAKLWTEYYAGKLSTDLCCGDNSIGHKGLFLDEALAAFTKAVREFLRGQYASLAQALKDTGIPGISTLLEDERWTRDLVEVIRPQVEFAVEHGGKFGMGKLPGGLDFEVQSEDVQNFIDEYTVRLADAVNNTTEHSLRSLLRDGQEQNRSVREISDAILELDDRVSGGRAQRIARTESTRASVEGEREAWKLSGVVGGKTWLLAPNACQFCRALKAQFGSEPIPLDQPFYQQGHLLVGVEGGRLKLDYSDVFGPPLHPHDRCDLLPVLMEETT